MDLKGLPLQMTADLANQSTNVVGGFHKAAPQTTVATKNVACNGYIGSTFHSGDFHNFLIFIDFGLLPDLLPSDFTREI